MDAITLLKEDHQTVEKLFKRFEQSGDRAFVERRNIVDSIIEELSKHAAIEEQLFYPVTRETVPAVEDIALESLEEHHVVKWLLHELEAMDPQDERFKPKVTVLMENVRHHVEEEEGDYFPKVRSELGRNALNELGDAMERAREIAPTHPHPKAPDTPPSNLVAGTASGLVDRVSDTVSGVAQGSVTAVRDLVGRITGSKKPAAAPKGSPTTKKAAASVRDAAADVVDRVADAKDRAEEAGRATVGTARSGAKATATSATKAAERTASAAKGGANRTAKAAKRTTSTAKSEAKRTATAASDGAKRTSTTAKGAATKTRRATSTSS